LIWSTATLVSATAKSFSQLLTYRVLLGIGQSVVSPSVFSIISDLFVSRRSFYLSFFTSMVYTGEAIGLGCGALSYATSWRLAFVTLGVPGIAIAIPFILTIRDPPRGLAERRSHSKSEVPNIRETDRLLIQDDPGPSSENSEALGSSRRHTLRLSERESPSILKMNEGVVTPIREEGMSGEASSKSDHAMSVGARVLVILRRLWWMMSYPPFTLLWLSGMVRYMAGYAIGGWIQVFYRRVHNVSPSNLSYSLAIIVPSAGATSAYLGGWIADKWEAKVTGGKAWLCAVSSFLGCIAMAAVLMIPSAWMSLSALWIEYLFAELWYAPAATIALDLNPPWIRSFAAAVYLACGCFGALSSALVGWLNAFFGVTITSENGTDGVCGVSFSILLQFYSMMLFS
jgi:MFS family permease